MNVIELMNVPQFQSMKVIAGVQGIEREISTVTMMDAPDIIHFLKEGELLVTTAYHVKDDVASLLHLIEEMSAKHCTALAIKTKRFMHEIPQQAIDLANALHFPLLELPLHMSLNEIVTYTLRSMLNERESELTLALDTHKQFTQLVMKGHGIHQLLKQLATMLDVPIRFVDQHLHVIANSHPSYYFDSLQQDFTLQYRQAEMQLSFIGSKKTYTFIPVHITERKCGFLMIAREMELDDQVARLVCEQAANVLSFFLMKEYALNQQRRHLRNEFFSKFLQGSYSSKETTSRLDEFQIPTNEPYVCVVAQLDCINSTYSHLRSQQLLADVFDFVESYVSLHKLNVHFFSKNTHGVLLFHVPPTCTRPSEVVEPFLLELQHVIQSQFKETISFGVSNMMQSFLQCKAGFKEASEALSKGSIAQKKQYIQFYDVKDITELLHLIPYENLHAFYDHTLHALHAIKNSDEREALFQTMAVFLETHCQIAETAKRLFIHRNTVVYRLEKCEELLGQSLKNAELTLQLRLAFRVRQLLDL